MTYQRVSENAWEWHDGARGYGVRAFASTRKLIWSSWMDTAEGPMFDDGIAQSFDDFLNGKPSPYAPPTAVLDELRAYLSPTSRKRR